MVLFFLGEAGDVLEDPDEEVEGAARELTATLAELSGEDLKSLMATGGE